MAEQGKNDKRTLYVGGLEENVTKEALEALFNPFGEIQDVNVPLDERTLKHRGFCFAQFEFAEDAAEAMDNLQDAEFFGKVLKINYAKPGAMLQAKAIWSVDSYHTIDEGGEQEKQAAEAKGKEIDEQLNQLEATIMNEQQGMDTEEKGFNAV